MRRLVRQLLASWKIRRSGQFDAAYYRAQPDCPPRLRFPVLHYVRNGWRAGLNPNAAFDTAWYLGAYPDVRRGAERLNPFLHYLEHGLGEARPTSASGLPYEEWIARCERYDPTAIRARLAASGYRPLLSVVVPVYRPELEELKACVDSVFAQYYDHWELCLSDDASGDPELLNYLERLAGDPRVRVHLAESNAHIAVNSNRALALASGDYVALLDQDDLLPPHALLEVVTALNGSPRPQIVYSDEDKLDEAGLRCMPHFKPDWNFDLLLAGNYVSHLGVYARGLVEAVGGFRAGYEGSQDYDLLLRCCARVEATQIAHVPRVLYHWRAGAGSTAAAVDEKSWTWDAGRRALEDFLAQQRLPASVSRGRLPNTFRLHWPLPAVNRRVTLIIPTRDGGGVLRRCVASILERTDYPDFELLLVDNQSAQRETLTFLERIARRGNVTVMPFDEPFNFSCIMNAAAARASGDYLALVNDDVEVISRDWLRELVGLAARPDVGCVGAKLYYPDDTVQHAGIILGINGVASHAHRQFPRDAAGYFGRLLHTQELAAVTAACLVVRSAVFSEAGGFDEEHLPIAFNDVDFCLRVRAAGYRNLWTPWAELYHHESLSRGYEDTPQKRERFEAEVHYMQATWGDALRRDPAYNPNLSLTAGDFSLRLPPTAMA